MKKFIYILTTLLLVCSCQEVIEIEIPSGEPRLVIDASFEYYLNEVPTNSEGGIRLSLSAPFFDDGVTAVNNATVFMTNLSDNSVVNYTPTGDNGFYEPDMPSFIPEFDTIYELTVVYNNETYIATTELISTVPINNVEQREGTLFEGDETEIAIFFTDEASREDYYLFDFDFNLYLPSEDRFYQGEEFNFSYFYESDIVGQQLTIKILGIDKRYFNYTSILIEQSDQGGGNPFQTPPVVIKGNIVNITNPDNYPLGYFNLSEANRFQITITE